MFILLGYPQIPTSPSTVSSKAEYVLSSSPDVAVNREEPQETSPKPPTPELSSQPQPTIVPKEPSNVKEKKQASSEPSDANIPPPTSSLDDCFFFVEKPTEVRAIKLFYDAVVVIKPFFFEF